MRKAVLYTHRTSTEKSTCISIPVELQLLKLSRTDELKNKLVQLNVHWNTCIYDSPGITPQNKYPSVYFAQNIASESYSSPNFDQPSTWLHFYTLEHTETTWASSFTNCMQWVDFEKQPRKVKKKNFAN